MFKNSLFPKKLTTDELNSLVTWIADLVWTVVDYNFILILFSLKRLIKEGYFSEESKRKEAKRIAYAIIIFIIIFFVIYALILANMGNWNGSGNPGGEIMDD